MSKQGMTLKAIDEVIVSAMMALIISVGYMMSPEADEPILEEDHG